MTDLSTLAASLSEAQRRALTRRPGATAAWAYLPTMRVLDRLGLISDWRGGSGWAALTSLGLALRDHLERNG